MDETKIILTFFLILVAKAVHEINEMVKSSDSASTLTALKSSDLMLRSITEECSDTYHEKLSQAKSEKSTSKELKLIIEIFA